MRRFNLSKAMGLVLAATMVAATPAATLAAAADTSSTAGGTVATATATDGLVVDASVATAKLADVIGKDADGNEAMYTTLRDADLKVVATNDPKQQVDDKYKPTSEGGKGTAVEKGATLFVDFRMAEIVENDGASGIQEGTVYSMGLPAELIPSAEDGAGNKLVDPEAPVTFFTSGGVKATGGIYTKAGTGAEGNDPSYELHIVFTDVAGQVDVAGEYQFSTTLSDKVEGGSTVTLTYVPGGKLSFKVAEDPKPDPDVTYSAEVSGGRRGATLYAIVSTLTKTAKEGAALGDDFDYDTFTVEATDKNQGVWIDTSTWADSNKPSVFNGYGANENYFSLAYSDESESHTLKADASMASVDSEGHGVVTFKDADKGLEVKVTFNGVLDGSQSSDTSYIATSYDVAVTKGNVKGLSNITLSVPTVLTGDYTGSGDNILYAVSLTAKSASGNDPLTAKGETSADLGSFSPASLTFTGYDGEDQALKSSLEWLPSSYTSYFSTNTTDYYGNYYWAEFTPNGGGSGSLDENYYVSLASFLPGGTLASSETSGYALANGKTSTFMNYSSGMSYGPDFGLYGGSSSPQLNWKYVGSVSISELLNSELSKIECFRSDSAADAKLQYQLRKVFANATPGQQLVVYRSGSKNSFGKYSYIVVDPRTVTNAIDQRNHGWYNYRDGSGTKAGSWRLHIFNAPQSMLQATFPQYLGTFDVGDTPNSETIANQVTVGNGSFNGGAASGTKTTGSTAPITEYKAAYMDSEWVSDNVIFWKMTINVSNWEKWSDGYVYVKTDGALNVVAPPAGATVSGQKVSGDSTGSFGNGLYYMTSGGSWAMLDGWANGKSSWYPASDSNASGQTIDANNYIYGYRILLKPTNSGSTIYRASDNTITIGFFTRVDGSPDSSRDDTYEATAQLVCHTGDATLIAGSDGNSWPTDYGSYSSDGQWAYRVSATGHAFTPRLAKNGASTDGATVSNLETKWTLKLSDLSVEGTSREAKHNAGALFNGGGPYPNGGVSGRISVGDTMKGSTVKDASGNEVKGVDAGKFTHVTGLLNNPTLLITEYAGGASCGGLSRDSGASWDKYVDGKWVAIGGNVCWDPNSPGIYRNTLSNQGSYYTDKIKSIYVYYAGNMSDNVYEALGGDALTAAGAVVTNSNFSTNSLVVEFRGLRNAMYIGDITYTTQTDVQGLYDAANAATEKTSETDALTQLYNVTLKNGAGFGAWKSSSTAPVSASVSSWITASLSIAKSTPGVTRSETTGGTKGSYTLNTQVGLSGTGYVNFEDYISGFSNVEVLDGATTKDGASYTEGEGNGSAALEALVGSLKVSNLKVEVTETSGNKYTIYENGKFTGTDWTSSTLNEKTGTHAGALYSGQFKRADGADIAAGTLFTFTYDLELDMDGDSAFRSSDYYDGGALKLNNGAVAERPYTTASDPTTTSVDEGAATDAAMALASGDVVELGDQNLQVVDDGISLAGGEVDKDNKLLRVWPDGDVEATYLAPDVLYKKAQNQGSSSNDNVTSWLLWDWTGTEGKGQVDRTLHDVITQSMDISLLEEREDLTDEQKQEYLAKLDELIGKYTTVANLKLYLTGSKPASASALSNDDLIWQIDGAISADQTATKDGHDLSLAYVSYSAGVDSEGVNRVVGPGFDITATDLGYNKYLVSTYDMVFDRDGFLKDAVEQGLLNLDGTLIGTTQTCSWSVKNGVDNGRGQDASASAGEVKVASSTVSKKASNVNASAGSADWTIDANTGTVAGNNELTIADEFSVAAESDAVAAAAKAATSIGDVKVTYASAAVWENGALTDAATKAGWTADNLSVTADGCSLTVKISNTDAFKPVANNKAVKVTYKTKLDKGAYVEALTNAGVTFAEGAPEYDLQNAAGLTVGSLKVSSSDKQTFKPDVPVEATKENEGHPGDDLATTRFTATGKTGEVKRLNFSLTDQVDTVDGTDAAKRDATLKAIKLTSLQVSISNPNGGTATYSAEKILSGSVEGVSLVRADGSALTLGEAGAADWKLVYDELDAATEVKVTYDVAVDREAYLAAGGEEGDTVTLQNALTVGSQDGAADADSSKGQITIQKQITKSGVLSEEKAANGNAIITWNFDVYLENSFSADQLAKLESVQVRDQLNPALKADASAVKVYDLKVADGKLAQGDELAAGDYEVTVSEANLLTITLKNPQGHRNIRIVAPTELAASLDSVSNTAELVVDGKVINKDEVEEPGSDAAGQWGSIVSVKTPVFTPSAEKYVDGVKAGAEYEGQFTFTCVEVDKDGNEVAGGYSATATNDAEGVATFEQIVYQAQPREGTHYYRIAETAGEGDFVYDTTVYTVQVTVVKNQKDGRYLVSGVVKTPADAATVRFDNSSKRDLTVTKAWDDNDDAAGARPASVTVHLYQNGEAVEGEGATVVLSKDNNWAYTWKDLPIAGGEYSVVEDEVKNYTGEAGKVELGEDGVWTIKLTNTYAPTVRDLSVTKAWDDNNDAAGKRPDHVVVTLRQGGKAVAGGTVVLNEENNWTYTWNDLAIEGGEYTVTEGKVDGYEASVGAVELGEDGVWRVTVTNKLEEEKPETRGLAVTKVWDDDDNLDELRPTSVTVRLCKDGKPVEGAAVELSEANNWTYTWSGLDKDGNYSVAEDEVENYTTKIGTLELGEDGVWRVTVTNRISDEVRDKRKKKEKPTDETPTSPSSDNKKRGNGGNDYGEGGSASSKPKVPYTGDTAIPVAPIAVAGVALVGVAGYLVVRSRKQD